MSEKENRLHFIKYIAALLIYGTNGVVASHIPLDSEQIVLLRTAIGSVLLVAIFLLSREKLTFYRYPKSAMFLAFSGVAMGLGWLFLFEAYRTVGVSVGTLGYYCGPVFVMALSPLLFGEALTRWKVLGFGAVVLGMVLLNGRVLGEGGSAWGLFCGIMSGVMLAALIICNKKAAPIDGLENSTIQLVTSFLIVAVVAGVQGGFAMEIPGRAWPYILLLGLVNTGFGIWLYFSSIGHLSVQTVAICGYLEPLSAVIFAVLFLAESLSPLQILGGALILGGAAFGELYRGAYSDGSGEK